MRRGTREEVELIEGKERRRWVQRIPVECWGLQGLRKEDAFFPPQDGAIQSLGKGKGKGKRSEGGCTEVGRLGICAQEAEGSGC